MPPNVQDVERWKLFGYVVDNDSTELRNYRQAVKDNFHNNYYSRM